MLFNSSQRKGVLILLALIVVAIVLPRQFLHPRQDFFLLPDAGMLNSDSLSLTDTIAKASPISRPVPPKKSIPQPLELNSADSTGLVALYGIGPYYAGKILRYRERLGGFHTVGQLKEVNMAYFNVDSNLRLFSANPALIVKRGLDTMSFKAVLRHPYLDYEDVKKIFNAKRKYLTVSYSLLEEKNILSTEKLKKIEPYFK